MLSEANLFNASFAWSKLQTASLSSADLRGAHLNRAQLQGAFLAEAQLQGASLEDAELQGALLVESLFQGASFARAQLQGANLEGVQLQGASLIGAKLHGANLTNAQLQGADLEGAQLHGASLENAQLQGARLVNIQLQGTQLDASNLTLAEVSTAYLWQSSGAKCDDAQVLNPIFSAVVEVTFAEDASEPKVTEASPEMIENFIENSLRSIPENSNSVWWNNPENSKERIKTNLRARLVDGLNADKAIANEKAWRNCAEVTLPEDEFLKKLGTYLLDLVCKASSAQRNVALGIKNTFIGGIDTQRAIAQPLARGFLGLDGRPCPGTENLDEEVKKELREIAAMKPSN